MPKVSAKRQITLPIDQCIELHIEPGDEIETYVYKGQITIVKKESGAAKGLLSHIKTKKDISDEESLLDGIDNHQGAA